MGLSRTLFRYIAVQYLGHFLALLGILLSIIYLFDTLELLRRAGSYPDVGFGLVLRMSLLKLPEVGQLLMPFAILFSGMFTFWKLNRTHELVVMRASGVSAWQFLTPLVTVALAVGLVATTVVNPVSSIMIAKFEQMETTHLHKKSSIVTLTRTGLWLRQQQEQGYSLIHAASFERLPWRMSDVIVFFFDDQDNFMRRIDSQTAYLRNGFWEIQRAVINDRDSSFHNEENVPAQDYLIATDLTPQEIEKSFSTPASLSFWRIPEYIRLMEETGFPVLQLKIHFQSLLARPFFFAAMILLAAAVSLRPPRLGGTGMLIMLGVSTGFFIFFLESMLHAFGISQKIPVLLAAWSPVTVSLLLGTAAILHLEDG